MSLDVAVLVAALVDYGIDFSRIRQSVAVLSVRKLAEVADAEERAVADTFDAWSELVESLGVTL